PKPLATLSDDLPLSALLSKVLLAFALEFERSSEVSLAICANVLRLCDGNVKVRDLPHLSGVSKESLAMALGFLSKRGYVRAKELTPTPKGDEARKNYFDGVDGEWGSRALRKAFESIVNENLLLAIKPYPNGWRASKRQPETLPHFPMVLHRGGYPDGS